MEITEAARTIKARENARQCIECGETLRLPSGKVIDRETYENLKCLCNKCFYRAVDGSV